MWLVIALFTNIVCCCFHESTVITYENVVFTKKDFGGMEKYCTMPYTVRNNHGYTVRVRCDPPFSNVKHDIFRNITLTSYHVLYTLDRGLQPIKNLRPRKDVLFGDAKDFLQCLVLSVERIPDRQLFFDLECVESNVVLANGIKTATFQISNLSSLIDL